MRIFSETVRKRRLLTARAAAGLLGLFVLAALAGCGGGGDGGGVSAPTTPVTVDIQWGARSRALRGPSSALSAVITLVAANPDDTDFVWTVNRDVDLAAHTTSYTSPSAVKAGTTNLIARFHAQPDGQGDVVGTAAATVTIAENGSGIGTVATTGTVASVALNAGQTLSVGQSVDLAFTARDAEGNPLALTPGSAFLAISGGSDVLQIVNGQAVALKPGTASVRVTVDDITSAPQTVTVISDAVVTISPTAATLTVNGTQTFTAAVANAGDQSVTWSVQEGAAGGTITSAGVYTAPATAGTFHVVATSNYDPSKTATATVTVQAAPSSGVSVSISPTATTIPVGGTQTFTATVGGTSNQGVTWSVQEGAAGGTILANGVYTAPATTGTFHVIATSVADPSVTATATVVVTVQPGSSTVTIN